MRVIRIFPNPHEVHVLAPDGSSQPISSAPGRPTYNQLEAMIETARKAKMEIFAVAIKASALPSSQGNANANAAAATAAAAAASASSDDADAAPPAGGFYSVEQVVFFCVYQPECRLLTSEITSDVELPEAGARLPRPAGWEPRQLPSSTTCLLHVLSPALGGASLMAD